MNISYKWLKEYVDLPLSPEETAVALTSIGLEVGGLEEVESIRGGLKGIVTAEVLTCEPHPDSDHMHVCMVDIGEASPSQIVCGAPNVAAGQKVVVATIGTKLYDGDKEFVIKRAKLRGVESSGMICAEDEIGIGKSHAGIIVLPADTPVGMPAAEYYHLESDTVIEVDITPNRADACSHYGVARDLYAWLQQNGYDSHLHRPDNNAFRVDNHNLEIAVEVEDTNRCIRYSAVTLTGCHIQESPQWLQTALTTVGLRPVNNIVDITNYIMLAFGQPLHCFDADMIDGRKVVVKTLPAGTPFQTLDGVEHHLSEDDLMICNGNEPMCLAGVFGGKGSGTYDTTTNVLLESACFHPTSIRKSARRHGLSTDASFRFERGTDPNATLYALMRAALMVKELAGGDISMEVKDVYPAPVASFDVTLNYDYANNLIGKPLDKDTYKSIAESLEMKIVAESDEEICLQVPTYRVDVQRPCDVVEDILRIYGYNNVEIPVTVQSALTVKGEADRSNKLLNIISEQLTAQGFHEMVNNSLTRQAYYEGLDTFASEACAGILNPLSEDLNVMRQTLLFGGLEVIRFNVNHKKPDLMLYETGNCYRYDASRHSDEKPLSAYREEQHLALWLTGHHVQGSWTHPDEAMSVYMLKAYVENVMDRLGVNRKALVEKVVVNDIFANGISLETRDGKVMAQYGIVQSKVTERVDVNVPVFYADINWSAVMKFIVKNKVEYTEISRFPVVSRDLALLLDKDIPFSSIEQVAAQTDRRHIQRVELFDVYEGKNLPEGKKSYAVNFILHDENKTMSNEQIEKIMQSLVKNLCEKLGASLR